MDWKSLLLSGLAGSVITQLFGVAWGEYKRHREYRALLDGIIAECDYNISIFTIVPYSNTPSHNAV